MSLSLHVQLQAPALIALEFDIDSQMNKALILLKKYIKLKWKWKQDYFSLRKNSIFFLKKKSNNKINFSVKDNIIV